MWSFENQVDAPGEWVRVEDGNELSRSEKGEEGRRSNLSTSP